MLLVAVLVLICTSSFASGRTITVGQSGCNYTSVQRAINASQSGDTVLVRPGTYYEFLVLKSGVSIVADSSGEVVLYSTFAPVVSAQNVSSGKVSGFVLEYAGTWKHNAVWITDSSVEISNNEIRGGTYSGVHVDGSANPVIEGNTITGSTGNGVYLAANSRATVRGNEIAAHGASGIHVRDNAEPEISGNVIHDNAENGIFSSCDSAGRFLSNEISGNGQKGIYVLDNANPFIDGNTIFDNTREGISIVRDANATVSNNEIRNHPCAGVYSGESAKILLLDNVILANHEGVIASGEVSIVLTGNLIKGNLTSGFIARDRSITHMESNAVLENDSCGIHATGAAKGDLCNNRILDNGERGVHVAGTAELDIQGNTILNNEACGIHAWGAASGEIRDNQIDGNDLAGIHLEEASDFPIRGNEISGNGHEGVCITGSIQRTVSENEISANGFAGIFVGETASAIVTENVLAGNLHEGICVAGDSTATIRGNSILSNVYVGIRTQDSAVSIIDDNTVSDNEEHGILAIGSSSGEISGNTIHDNVLYGVSIQDDASFVLEGNAIAGNGQASVTIRGHESPEVAAAVCPQVIRIAPSGTFIAIQFQGGGGDLRSVRVEVLEGALQGFTWNVAQQTEADQAEGVVDGEFDLPLPIAEPGAYRLRITLVDALGLEGGPSEIEFQATFPHAPEILGGAAPALLQVFSELTGSIQFRDLDGDLASATIGILDGALDGFTLDLTQPPYAEDVVGQAEGQFSFEIVPPEPGQYRIQLTLVDATGLGSEPYEFSFEAYAPTAPVVDRVMFPTSIDVGDDHNGLVRFEDPEGDVVEARFQVIEGDASTIEIEPGFSFDPEVAGETDGAFRFSVRVSQPQTVTLSLTLVDAAGLESDPYEFTFDAR